MADDAFQSLKGMSDLTSPEVEVWQYIEARAREVLRAYAFREVRTPILERLNVFVRSLGDTTDIVQKEMYAFEDRGGRHIALRPEGTAGVMRHVAGAGQDAAEARLYYMGPMFRAERPQAGRKRQFHQIGVEAIGGADPLQDAEIIALQCELLKAWGLEDYRIQVNTRGAFEERADVAASLREALRPRFADLCEDCRRRFEENILRVLDCKQEGCKQIVAAIPSVTEFMSDESRAYFSAVTESLTALGIPHEVNPLLVRGLDYYLHTVWEISSSALGAQDALAGGGRYVVSLGKREIEGVGFGMGMERLVTALQADPTWCERLPARPLVFLIAHNDEARTQNLTLAGLLRAAGISCRLSFGGRSMKAQMKAAHRAGCTLALIRGESELADGTCQLKDMEEGGQESVTLDQLLDTLNSRLDVGHDLSLCGRKTSM